MSAEGAGSASTSRNALPPSTTTEGFTSIVTIGICVAATTAVPCRASKLKSFCPLEGSISIATVFTAPTL